MKRGKIKSILYSFLVILFLGNTNCVIGQDNDYPKKDIEIFFREFKTYFNNITNETLISNSSVTESDFDLLLNKFENNDNCLLFDFINWTNLRDTTSEKRSKCKEFITSLTSKYKGAIIGFNVSNLRTSQNGTELKVYLIQETSFKSIIQEQSLIYNLSLSKNQLKISSISQNKDMDFDTYSDIEDNCKSTKGTIRGCPDTDGDGVIDEDDKCPNMAPENGIPMINGCPDSDGDGLPDKSDVLQDSIDRCPNESGPLFNSGCPLDYKELKALYISTKRIHSEEPISNLYFQGSKLLSTNIRGKIQYSSIENGRIKKTKEIDGLEEGKIPKGFVLPDEKGRVYIYNLIRKKGQDEKIVEYLFDFNTEKLEGGIPVPKTNIGSPINDSIPEELPVINVAGNNSNPVSLKDYSINYYSGEFIAGIKDGQISLWKKVPESSFWMEVKFSSMGLKYTSMTIDEKNQMLFAGTDFGKIEIYQLSSVE